MFFFNSFILGPPPAPPGNVSIVPDAGAESYVGTVPGLYNSELSPVTVLLHMDGSNGASVFTDSSGGNVPISAVGPVVTSTSSPKFGTAAASFSSGSYLTWPAGNAVAFGTGPFTVEFWIKTSTVAVAAILQTYGLGTTNNGIYIYQLNHHLFAGIYQGASSVNTPTGTAEIADGAWHHVAFVRSVNGATLSLFVDGVLDASIGGASGFNVTPAAPGAPTIGVEYDSSSPFVGSIDEFRITLNAALYASSFTPASSAFTDSPGRPFVATGYATALPGPASVALTGFSPFIPGIQSFAFPPVGALTVSGLAPVSRVDVVANPTILLHMDGANAGTLFPDSSLNAIAVTGGNVTTSTSAPKYGTAAALFAGTGYLTWTTGSTASFGSSPYTIEMWVNTTSTSVTVLYQCSGFTSNGPFLFMKTTGTISYTVGSSSTTVNGTIAINDGAWHHIAICRVSNTVTIYVDGVSNGSATISGSHTPVGGSSPTIGADENQTSANLTGQIDDFRLTLGTARYTANFTPPTQAFPDPAGTNTNRAPGAGGLTIAGAAPTATASGGTDIPISVGVGSVTISGAAPTVIAATYISPAAGAATATGAAPVVTTGTYISPAAGAATATGATPTATTTANAVALPSAGSVTFSGATPSVLSDSSAQPSAGSVTFSGAAPTISVNISTSISPGVGNVTVAGAAPTSSALLPDPLASISFVGRYEPWREAYANGNSVPTLTDWSGNVNTLAQATSGKQPTFISSSIGGVPGIAFDGVDDVLHSASIPAMNNAPARWYYVVFEQTATPTAAIGAIFEGINSAATTGTGDLAYVGDGTTVFDSRIRFSSSTDYVEGDFSLPGTSVPIVLKAVADGATFTSQLTGQTAQSFSQPTPAPNGTYTFQLGAFGAPGSEVQFLGYQVAAAYMGAGTLTSGQIATIEAYLSSKYGVGSSNTNISPAAGAVTVTGAAPTAATTANAVALPSAGSVAFSGVAPTVSISGNVVSSPGAGSITASGLAPTATVSSGAGAPVWDPAFVASPLVLSNSNTRLTEPTGNSAVRQTVRCTAAMSPGSGKWYWEIHIIDVLNGSGTTTGFGMASQNHNSTGANLATGTDANSFGLWLSGTIYKNGSSYTTADTYADGDVAMFAYDTATGEAWTGKNGAWHGTSDPTTPGTGFYNGFNTTLNYYPAASPWSSIGETVVLDIVGASSTTYSVPTGYTAYHAVPTTVAAPGAGAISITGVAPSQPTNNELREDGGIELREDGSIELRE